MGQHILIGGALLILFTSYLGTIITYTHLDFVDGVLVVHAHKRTKEQKDNPFHQHSSSELVQLHQMSDLSTMGVFAFFNAIEPPFCHIIKLETWEHVFVDSHFYYKVIRRGPPVIEL